MFVSKVKLLGYYVLIVYMNLILFIAPVQVAAEAEEYSEINFYVTPILPESQLNQDSSYFDINIEPGETDALGLEIKNTSEKELKIEVTAHTAFTNVNGVVEYGLDADHPDPTLPHSIADLLEVPDIVTIEAGQTKNVEIPFIAPDKPFEGVLAGGILIQEAKVRETESSDEEGLAIRNEFNYLIGVVLSNERTMMEPELEVLDVFASQLNYRNVISATVQNYLSTYANNLSITAQVRRNGEDEILYSAERDGMQMAPNSHFDFPIPLDGERFVSGDYILSLQAESMDNEWSWNFPFSIEAEEARQLNREDVTITTGITWHTVFLLVIVMISFCIILYLFIRNRRNN